MVVAGVKKPWANRIVGHATMDVATLLAGKHSQNWRVHPEAQREALAGMIDEVGFVRSVVYNQQTGHVLDGHLRIDMADGDQEPTLPVEIVDLTEREERLVLATLDPLAGMAVANDGMLRDLIAGLDVQDERISALLDGILAPFIPKPGYQVREDGAPSLPVTPRSRAGDLWLCGGSRVLCGDATNPDDVARLLASREVGTAVPTMTVSDPPYGVSYDPAWRQEAAEKGLLAYAARRVGDVPNDDRVDWSDAWRLAPGDVLYTWHAGKFAAEVQRSLESCGFEVRSQIIWSKPHFPISRGHYHWRHEPAFYAVRKGGQAHWVGDRKQTTIWRTATDPNVEGLVWAITDSVDQEAITTVWEVTLDHNVAGGHSTQKPVELMARSIRNHAGDVYEPFAGSGTTLSAAVQLGRRCYAMDVDARYVDVVVGRWEALTGEQAVHAVTGQYFTDTEA